MAYVDTYNDGLEPLWIQSEAEAEDETDDGTEPDIVDDEGNEYPPEVFSADGNDDGDNDEDPDGPEFDGKPMSKAFLDAHLGFDSDELDFSE